MKNSNYDLSESKIGIAKYLASREISELTYSEFSPPSLTQKIKTLEEIELKKNIYPELKVNFNNDRGYSFGQKADLSAKSFSSGNIEDQMQEFQEFSYTPSSG
jgi:hypothetical protein